MNMIEASEQSAKVNQKHHFLSNINCFTDLYYDNCDVETIVITKNRDTNAIYFKEYYKDKKVFETEFKMGKDIELNLK